MRTRREWQELALKTLEERDRSRQETAELLKRYWNLLEARRVKSNLTLKRPELLTVETVKSGRRLGVAAIICAILFIMLLAALLGAAIGRLGC